MESKARMLSHLETSHRGVSSDFDGVVLGLGTGVEFFVLVELADVERHERIRNFDEEALQLRVCENSVRDVLAAPGDPRIFFFCFLGENSFSPDKHGSDVVLQKFVGPLSVGSVVGGSGTDNRTADFIPSFNIGLIVSGGSGGDVLVGAVVAGAAALLEKRANATRLGSGGGGGACGVLVGAVVAGAATTHEKRANGARARVGESHT